jgi:hypothetical protein
MTEEWWRRYKDNKDKNENKLFTTVESELKRKFKNERSPEELYSMCKTDNNYWKHYRNSENLDPDAISLVLCKDIGCDLMYCQAMTHKSKPGDQFFGCKEQYDGFRDCYIQEKRKFNNLHKEEEWLKDRQIIPMYIEKQLLIQKEQKERLKTHADMKVVAKMDESKIVEGVPKVGYF